MPDWVVVNFSHPMLPAQREDVARMAGGTVARVIDVSVQFDESAPFADQAAALIAAVPLSGAEWQTLPLLVNPPAYAPITVLVLARLHGLVGHFPRVLRLRRGAAGFEVAEILDLQSARNEGRGTRQGA